MQAIVDHRLQAGMVHSTVLEKRSNSFGNPRRMLLLCKGVISVVEGMGQFMEENFASVD